MIDYQLTTVQMVGLWGLVASVIAIALLLGDTARLRREQDQTRGRGRGRRR